MRRKQATGVQIGSEVKKNMHAPGINGTWKWTGGMKWIAKNTFPSVFNKGRQLIVTCPAELRNVRGWTSYFLTGVKGLAFEAG